MDGYMTIKETAELWGLSPRWIQTLCSDGKIDGAVKFGSVRAIPSDANRPKDSRVTTGEYRNWRKK